MAIKPVSNLTRLVRTAEVTAARCHRTATKGAAGGRLVEAAYDVQNIAPFARAAATRCKAPRAHSTDCECKILVHPRLPHVKDCGNHALNQIGVSF